MVEEKKKTVVKKVAAVTSSKTAKVAATKVSTAKKTALPSVWPFPTMETEAPARKVPAKKTPAKITSVSKPAVKKSASVKPVAEQAAKPTPEERYRMVETAAYFIAERSGFRGCTTEHWAAAEIEIAARLDK